MDAKVFEFLLKLKDGLVNPKNRNRVLGGGAAAAVGLFIWSKYSNKKPKHKGAIVEGSKIPSHKRAALNRHFVRMLAKLLRIIIPSWKSKEVFLLIMHSGFLLARTVASVYFATLDGQIVKSLVSGEGKEFAKKIIWWLIFSIPVAFVNSMLRYLQHRLSISFRSRLTHHIHKEYMENETFYKLENLDTRIRNADQCITADVAKFCHALADLYSNLAKPSLDCIIYNAKLAHNVGFKGLFVITCLIHTGTFVLRKFTPPFGRLVAEEQRLEGNFRFAHSRIITNAEEIAFYGGSEIEKNILDETYSALVRHVDIVHLVRLNYGTLESYITKYFWGALGFLICSLPVFTPFGRPKGISGNSLSDHTKDFITNRRLLISTADAFERLIEGYKEIIELAGYTSRVYELLEVIEDVRAGHFKNEAFAPEKQHGTVSDSDIIKCDNVSIVSPNGDLLIQNLTFEVPVGAHLLITGPNGCGKSSLFRILGGLWPLLEGSVKKPTRKQIFYIPQRPYLSQGTLRDQVIYPNSLQEIRGVGVTDEDLAKVLELVKLNYIVDREGGWDAKKEWKDVLSGGEKQRMAMARLFFHKPRYAILDECTSAVSIDVEGSMYNTAKELGISLITVSHRTSLWKYHTYLLEFDGNGNYRFVEIDNLSGKDSSISNLSLEEEKRILEARVQEDSQRIKKIDSLLGE